MYTQFAAFHRCLDIIVISSVSPIAKGLF